MNRQIILYTLARWFVISLSVAAAAWLVPGIRIEGNSAWIVVLVMAVVLGFVNAIIRPILAFLSLGCIMATLGLFTLVVNGVTLWLASWIAVNWLNVGFFVDGIWPAVLGAVVISVVSFILALILTD
jgi:putative membrane protein